MVNMKDMLKNGIVSKDDMDVDDGITETTALRTRNAVTTAYATSHSKLASDNIVYLERDIGSTDTLQSFALYYGCTLADLKRANNLITDQDFFALRRIKIPVKKYGLLTEPEEEQKRRPVVTTSLVSSSLSDQNLLRHSEHNKLVTNAEKICYNDDHNNCNKGRNDVKPSHSFSLVHHRDTAIEHNDAKKFLKTVDKEILSTVKKSENKTERNEALEEVVSSLGSVGFQPFSPKRSSECDGASWGLKWSTVMISFVVGMLFVLAYILIVRHVVVL